MRKEAALIGIAESDRINCGRLVEKMQQGVAGTSELFDRYMRNIAVGIANLQQTLSLSSFILHGDIVSGGDIATARLKQHVENLVARRPNQQISILTGGNGEGRTALRGTAGLILSDHLKLAV